MKIKAWFEETEKEDGGFPLIPMKLNQDSDGESESDDEDLNDRPEVLKGDERVKVVKEMIFDLNANDLGLLNIEEFVGKMKGENLK